VLSFGILYHAGLIPWSLTWFLRKQEAGTLLADLGRTSHNKISLSVSLLYLVILVYLFLEFALWYLGFGLYFLLYWCLFFQFSWLLVLSFSKLEFRENGICFQYSLIQWHRINSYIWEQSKPNTLIIRYKPRLQPFSSFIKMVIPTRYKNKVSNILEKRKIMIPAKYKNRVSSILEERLPGIQ